MPLARLAARIAPLAALAVTGCLAPAPVPDPQRIEPSWADKDQDTTIRIFGDRFYPALGISSPDGSGPDLGYHVALQGPAPSIEQHEIVFVDQLEPGTISAVVPAGLPVGTYGVVVEAASGQVGTRAGVLEVCDACIHAVALTLEPGRHVVHEPAPVGIRLVDASGGEVGGELDVVVELLGADGRPPDDGRLVVDGLAEQVAIGPFSIQGRLEGTATARPELYAPGTATLQVRPANTADPVIADDVPVTFTVGDDLRVVIDLPTPDFSVRAGESFPAVLSLVDTYGNLAEGESALIAITDACNSWGTVVTLAPKATVSARPTEASRTTRCPTDALIVTGVGIAGATSASFDVRPGELRRLEAEVLQSTVAAGEVVTVLVRPVDAFGNATTWTEEVAAIDDGAGGVSDFSCQRGFTYNCSVLVTRSAPVVQLKITDTSLRTGTSNAFSVVAGPAERLLASAPAPVWTAGEPNELVIAAADAWGNAVPGAALDEATIEVEGAHGEVACDPGTPGDGRLSCVLYDAGVDTLVVGSSATDEADQVEVTVTNAALAAVEVRPDGTSVRAGDALGVALLATDAWGNPWIVRSDDVIDLTSDVDAFRPVEATIGPGGTGSTLVYPTFAGYTELVAWHGDLDVGRSDPVLVEPGPTRSLRVTTDGPWAWVGEPTAIGIQALDLYGNRTGLTDVVDVTTDSGAASASVLVQNGVGEGSLTWDAFVLDDAVSAVDAGTGTITGRLAPFSAVRPCAPAASPAVDVSFGGSSFARACTDAAGRALVTGQVVSHAASGATIVAHGISVGSSVGITASSTVRVTIAGAGVYEARALAVQDDGCASELQTSAWIGPRDGGPVGPLDVSLDRADLDLEGYRHTATVHVADVLTCDGLPATGRGVRVRTDRGGLTGAVASGSGLVVTADATGTATAVLDASLADEGGPATVTAWRADGLARGAATVTVHGDVRPPTVRSFSVEGSTDVVGTAVVRFSERMDVATIGRPAVLVLGPIVPTYTVRSLDAGRSLAIDFDPPIGPTPGGWQVVVQPLVSDDAGNLLAGTWTGRTDAWSGWFGATSAVEPVASCALDAAVFRPDGDDGGGAERDAVRFSFSSVTSPVWWSLLVTGPDDEVIRALQLVPTGNVDAWRWDGRDETGAVVPAGRYRLTVDTKGSRGNRGGACSREVAVDLVEVIP